MRINNKILFFFLATSVNAFVTQKPSIKQQQQQTFLKATQHNNDNDESNNNNWLSSMMKDFRRNQVGNIASLVIGSSLLWASPAMMASTGMDNTHSPNTAIVHAIEKASGSGSRVNKDADSLLRYGLPINNKEVRSLQTTIETIQQDLASKRKGAAIEGAKKAQTQMTKTAKAMTTACRDADICTSILKEMDAQIDPLVSAIKSSQDAFTGSEQERTAIDKAYSSQLTLSEKLTNLQEAMVPAGYKTKVPADYNDLPQLQGRATVEFTFAKAEKDQVFDINGVNYQTAKMTMIIDGYVAPVTGGNFVELVDKGFYTNMKIQRSDGFVVQTGDPDGPAVGYVNPTGGYNKSVGKGKQGERLLPLEITLTKDYPSKSPLYEVTLDEEGRGGEATVLPFSSYGAMGWAREEYSPNSGSSQFFWLLFDSDLTPAGKNLLDGNYPCFGYVVKGADFLSDIKEGDIITSAKVVKGMEYLKLPPAPATAPAAAPAESA